MDPIQIANLLETGFLVGFGVAITLAALILISHLLGFDKD